MRPGGFVDSLPGIVAVSALGLGFVALGVGDSWFWVAGSVSLGPLAAVVSDALVTTDRDDDAETSVSHADALGLLRERYARGELDEDAFERRVDQLLATEPIEETRDRVRPPTDDPKRELEAERA